VNEFQVEAIHMHVDSPWEKFVFTLKGEGETSYSYVTCKKVNKNPVVVEMKLDPKSCYWTGNPCNFFVCTHCKPIDKKSKQSLVSTVKEETVMAIIEILNLPAVDFKLLDVISHFMLQISDKNENNWQLVRDYCEKLG
jgi:hypothetical protein